MVRTCNVVVCQELAVFEIRANSSEPVEDTADACYMHVGVLLGSNTLDRWGSYTWTVGVISGD